ncbi:hypothetical protein I6N96_07315 [Enterococcus sp. BWM-S5]|uniref:Lipoprotein n=1 Tax=Enterococcus larvae TaxID=2794352 RepID=A0ABS4CIS9_9ENTE|nr:hypothetical protein [Enterococcus larvae]MBP1046088.1 hypothetical protein [Enterococcus larvae]
MKKRVVLFVGLTLFLTGCSPLTGGSGGSDSEQKTESLLGAFDQAVEEAKKDSSEAKAKESTATSSSSSTEKASESSAPAVEVPTEPTIDKSSYPFGVSMMDIVNVGTFTKTGMNVPQTIMVSFVTESNGSVALVSNGGRTEYYTAQYRLIPTTTIRVFSANRTDSNDIRTVNVNTEIVIEYLTGTGGAYDAGNFYVFTNSSGTLSLATPNYAGNVMESESDVMLEYLP